MQKLLIYFGGTIMGTGSKFYEIIEEDLLTIQLQIHAPKKLSESHATMISCYLRILGNADDIPVIEAHRMAINLAPLPMLLRELYEHSLYRVAQGVVDNLKGRSEPKPPFHGRIDYVELGEPPTEENRLQMDCPEKSQMYGPK